MSEYSCILTDIGLAQIANAQLTDDVILITQIAVGDGAGLPDQSRNSLRNETWRGNVSRIGLSPNDNGVLEVEGHIPPEEGGFTIREAGLFDENGDMIAMANLPETYKPVLAEGSGVDTLIKIMIAVQNTSNITLKVDPTIVLATQNWVNETLMERDLAIANAQILAAKNLIDNNNQDNARAADLAQMDAALARISALEHNQSVISERASRAILT